MIVSKWTAGVLETFDDEWFNIAQLHAEVESRSGETCNYKVVERAVMRMSASGVVESRWDVDSPKVDSQNWGCRGQKVQRRKEYRWA